MKNLITAAPAMAFDASEIQLQTHCHEVASVARTAALAREIGMTFDRAVTVLEAEWQPIAAAGYLAGEDTVEFQQAAFDRCILVNKREQNK